MRRFVPAIATLVAFLTGPNARAQDDVALLQTLQKSMTKVIHQNENSIACILVSRSELHPHDAKNPGKLGGYDPDRLLIDPKLTNPERLQLQKKHDLADATNIPPAFGSGVVIDAQGLVLTNYHVVQEATKIYVRLPGGQGSYADIHAADPRSDLAVLKLLNANLFPLKSITFGDADNLQRGQFVVTLSNPFAAGFRDGQPSASYGILSNIRRRALTQLKEEERVKPLHHYGTLLQTDARLNLGCSGGALLNLKGELVGLLTSMAAIQGGETPGGFAIPVNGAMHSIIDVLKRGEEVDYGFLGIGPGERAGKVGVAITNVGKGSPAEIDARLKSGDVLLAVNGRPVHDVDDIFLHVGMHLAGTKIKLHVRSIGIDRIADVTLAKLYVPDKKVASSTGNRPYFRGLRVDHASLLVQQPPRWFHIPRGVLISDVQPNTSAHQLKLKSGDVITHVNQLPVASPAAFYQAVAGAVGPLELTVYNEPPTKVVLK